MQLVSSKKLTDEIQAFNILLQESSFEDATSCTHKITEYLAEKFHFLKCVFYIFSEEEKLYKASAFYGCDLLKFDAFYVKPKQGIVGQAAYSKKAIYFESVN